MKKIHRILLYGFLIWLIPFIVSLPFYSKSGELLIDLFLFKTIMLIVSSLTLAFFIIEYFKKITSNYHLESIKIGFSWLFINLFLDLIVLVGIFEMLLKEYLIQIGFRYLTIPIITITTGYLLYLKTKK